MEGKQASLQGWDGCVFGVKTFPSKSLPRLLFFFLVLFWPPPIQYVKAGNSILAAARQAFRWRERRVCERSRVAVRGCGLAGNGKCCWVEFWKQGVEWAVFCSALLHIVSPHWCFKQDGTVTLAPLQLIPLDRCNQVFYTNCTAAGTKNCAVMIFSRKKDTWSIF